MLYVGNYVTVNKPWVELLAQHTKINHALPNTDCAAGFCCTGFMNAFGPFIIFFASDNYTQMQHIHPIHSSIDDSSSLQLSTASLSKRQHIRWNTKGRVQWEAWSFQLIHFLSVCSSLTYVEELVVVLFNHPSISFMRFSLFGTSKGSEPLNNIMGKNMCLSQWHIETNNVAWLVFEIEFN